MTLHESVGAITILLIAWSLYRAHKDKDLKELNLFDLIIENKRISRIACLFIASWIVTSLVIWKLTTDGKMTEGYFLAYGSMWVAPLIAKMFAPPTNPPQVAETKS